jgi:hypothetical protein
MPEPVINNVDDLAAEGNTQQQQQQAQANQDDGDKPKIELDADVYEALLDRIEELETKPKVDADDDIDYLADEALGNQNNSPQPKPIQGQPKNFDDMTRQELVNHIVSNVVAKISEFSQPLVNEVQLIKVQRETDRAAAKYDDFEQYEKEVMHTALRHPTLTIEDAYKMVKSGKADKADKGSKTGDDSEGKDKRTATEKLLKLPPRRDLGHKPSVASGTVKEAKILSLEDAISAAAAKIDLGNG